ncbi:galanin receptor 2b-like [Saccoglossus kowalevskii]|uniref:Octopamine receptor 1-like n=1 Tax=Saccoglossus kowalevskii TaxID=10224 RepID=A0ABM0GMT5_SACKO|nr:PREDICTED: octopamine receptor 1-like [Saccoglossus kowalevskii]
MSVNDSNFDFEYSFDYYAFLEEVYAFDTPPEVTVSLGVLFMFLIIAGNLWVIIAVFRQPKLRKTATNIFIVSLSVSDLLLAVVFVPFHIGAFAYGMETSNKAVCNITAYLHWAAQCGTTFSLLCIGVDRFRAIVQPLRPKLTLQHAAIGCVLVWVCALGYSCGKFATVGIVSRNDTIYIEQGNDTITAHSMYHFCYVTDFEVDKILRIFDFLVMYAIPLVILATLYSIMVFTLWFSKAPTNSGNRSKRKAIKMLSFVVLQFAITWLPINVIQMYYAWTVDFPLNPFLWSIVPSNLCVFILMCNSWINPILYAYFNESFRKEFRKLFPCFYKCKGSKVSAEGSSMTGDDANSTTRAGGRTGVSMISSTVT